LAALHLLNPVVVEHIALTMAVDYGVGDFITIITLVQSVYTSYKDSPDSFGNIASGVSSLRAVLQEAQEIVSTEPLSPTRRRRLHAVLSGCHLVLQDLQELFEKYEESETEGTGKWDRMRGESENIAELRTRLTSNALQLTAWIR
jgi:hypothetical protein